MNGQLEALEIRLGELESDLARAEYAVHAGLDPVSRTAEIYARFADLLTVENVRVVLSAYRDLTLKVSLTERRRLAQMRYGLTSRYLEAQVAPLQDRLVTHQNQIQVPFPDGPEPYLRASLVCVTEPDRERRMAMWQSIGEISQREITPLARAVWEARQKQATALGFRSYATMFARLQFFRLETLTQDAKSLLALTEDLQREQLTAVMESEIGIHPSCATSADLNHVLRRIGETRDRTAIDVMAAVRHTLDGLGIDLQTLPGLQYDIEDRPGKRPRAAMYPILPPREVIICCLPTGGLATVQSVMHETGHGMQHAHMAETLPASLRLVANLAVTEAFAFLFDFLTVDPLWLQDVAGLNARRAREIADLQLLSRRTQARILCAQGLFALEVDRDLSDKLAAKYQRIFHQAGMVLHHKGTHLTSVDTDLYPFNYLIGLELEAQISEYLKLRFGPRWWAEPRAGDRLKRVWAEGFTWTPLTLARIFGFTNLSPGALVRRLIQDWQKAAGRGSS